MVTESKYGLTQSDITKITAVFAQHPEIIEAVLYGSRALGRFRNGSDIDLTLTRPYLVELAF
jgi:predicted nucleotidyltransferase